MPPDFQEIFVVSSSFAVNSVTCTLNQWNKKRHLLNFKSLNAAMTFLFNNKNISDSVSRFTFLPTLGSATA